MNVFVLSTGRCGTTTLALACSSMSNFSASHESNWGKIGPGRFSYPDQHIEIDNRLSWFLGELHDQYGDDARYVHLIRDPEKVARSFMHRWHVWESSVAGYGRHILCVRDQSIEVARAHVATVNSNICQFMHDKPHTMTLHLEEFHSNISTFWEWIGAEGDLEAALNELQTDHNSTESNPPPSPPPDPTLVQRVRYRLALAVAGKQPNRRL